MTPEEFRLSSQGLARILGESADISSGATFDEFADVLAEVPSEEPDAPGYSVHRSPCPYEHGGACTCS